MHRLALHKYAH